MSELDIFFVLWFIEQRLYEGNHSPLFNEQVIKDIYNAHPHLYEDDKHGINMTGTQRDNKRRCVIRLCSNKFSAFIGLVYGDDKYETIIFAQKGKKRREAEKNERDVAKKLVKTEQETNSANSYIKNEKIPVVIESEDTDKGSSEATRNEEIPVVIESEHSDEGTCVTTDEVVRLVVSNVHFRNVIQNVHKIEGEDADEDAVMTFYNNKNNVPFRTMLQKIHALLVEAKPIEGLIHNLNDATTAVNFCSKTVLTYEK